MYVLNVLGDRRKKVRINVKKGVILYGEVFIDYIVKNEFNISFDFFLGGIMVNIVVGV